MDLMSKFEIALLLTNLTFREFARLHGVGHSYIHMGLSGKQKFSPRIQKAVDEFVNSQMMILKSNLLKEAA